jgi:cytochrome c oxidase subunit 2
VTPWGSSDALAPAGLQAARIAGLWWVFVGVCAVVYAALLVALGLALLRRGEPDDRWRVRVVAACAALTVLTLLVLLGKSVLAGKALSGLAGQAQVTVRVIARQWWWELQYEAEPPSQMVITANELHLPTGQPVLLKLESRDVIHSFWVPSLHGKRDLIPGHPSTTYLQVDRPGLYRGQCAEFCGAQHAHMGLVVIAEPPQEFARWMSQARTPPPAPVTDEARRGREVFQRGPCILCHAVSGTIALASAGPDLTHVASRRTLAAGTLPNAPEPLARWVRDAQSVKPGAHMPPLALPAPDLRALLAYLETLQ